MLVLRIRVPFVCPFICCVFLYFILATFQGIGVFICFVYASLAAPAWSTCSFPSVPMWAFVQAKVRYFTCEASVPTQSAVDGP